MDSGISLELFSPWSSSDFFSCIGNSNDGIEEEKIIIKGARELFEQCHSAPPWQDYSTL
jgi:hypothetical protein